jgi:hypothetical protein
MSIFQISFSLCDKIEKMNSFWWSHFGSQNKDIHGLSWDKLTIHKNMGDMNFKNLNAFDFSLLGKQG